MIVLWCCAIFIMMITLKAPKLIPSEGVCAFQQSLYNWLDEWSCVYTNQLIVHSSKSYVVISFFQWVLLVQTKHYNERSLKTGAHYPFLFQILHRPSHYISYLPMQMDFNGIFISIAVRVRQLNYTKNITWVTVSSKSQWVQMSNERFQVLLCQA